MYVCLYTVLKTTICLCKHVCAFLPKSTCRILMYVININCGVFQPLTSDLASQKVPVTNEWVRVATKWCLQEFFILLKAHLLILMNLLFWHFSLFTVALNCAYLHSIFSVRDLFLSPFYMVRTVQRFLVGLVSDSLPAMDMPVIRNA